MNTSTIPVFDLANFREGNGEHRQQLADSVALACREIGFLVVRGHGVTQAVQEDLYRSGIEFFNQSLDQKLTVRRPRNDQNRGYIPYGEETLARMHGSETPPDFKEVFAVGPDDHPDTAYFTGPASYPSFAPNLWPDSPATLRPAMTAYFKAMENLMRLLGELFTVALALPIDYFTQRLDKHTSQLRLLHYPVPTMPLATDQLRCGEHTDLGMITILRNEATSGGLQIKNRSGDWINAPAVDDTFIVNVGDMMMRWTNDEWISTPHRVAVPEPDERRDSRRLSIGYFVGPNYDAIIECLPGCVKTGQQPRYPAVSVHDYRTDRFAAGAGRDAGAIGGAD